jgi:uncharacterized protein (DUF2235 family)
MKRLVVCFDGTWNSADSDNAETNVAVIARSIHASQHTGGVQQSVLYLRGIGSLGFEFQRFVDAAIGQGIDGNIRSAYMFLAQNYVPGDEIFLFGFSRGAFTARSLSGLIGACGLLKRQRLADVPKAWKYYREAPKRSPEDFVKTFATECHTDVHITFLGVWDTVGSLGIPSHIFAGLNQEQYGFHHTSPSKITKHGYHAMAIDEFRDEFVPTLWTGEIPEGCHIEQVWFAGAHSDVGGGYADRGLADIPLVWMAKKAEGCGLALDWSVLPDPLKLDHSAPSHNSRHGFSIKDRWTPTFREVCQRPFKVDFYERLYRSSDADGQPLKTINEAIHSSVVERYGKDAQFSPGDKPPERSNVLYKPRNLSPLFNGKHVRKTAPVSTDANWVAPEISKSALKEWEDFEAVPLA